MAHPDTDPCRNNACLMVYLQSGCATAWRPNWTDDEDPQAKQMILFQQHAREHEHVQGGNIIILHASSDGHGLIAQQDFLPCPLIHQAFVQEFRRFIHHAAGCQAWLASDPSICDCGLKRTLDFHGLEL